ncbi:type IV conjugative transfer system lipoprotein TraV [Rhodoferax antarcticus ANT.BR]|uniref:Type IV conjugative transfer system lipoprotein TraV n=2 Tax=Rhodoferax antarcticus TaxID=81479 RepID=A0A1Q8Y936_9BURK|nr:type IV conjugative transfer system lipoprotein TraV [Rhodoferax antarcticus ANT.BR]
MKHKRSFSNICTIAASLVMVGTVAGCASLVNTADNADFGCPGMPLGVTCKTPAAVYNSTNGQLPISDFDTPIGAKKLASGDAGGEMSIPEPKAFAAMSGMPVTVEATSNSRHGPKPVREAAKVVRIWIAPWVDKEDNLHLAQLQYTEVTPRYWTVGMDEVKSGSSYVIPHIAFNNIPLPVEAGKNPNDRSVGRSSDGSRPPVSLPQTPSVQQ